MASKKRRTSPRGGWAPEGGGGTAEGAEGHRALRGLGPQLLGVMGQLDGHGRAGMADTHNDRPAAADELDGLADQVLACLMREEVILLGLYRGGLDRIGVTL